MDRVESLSIRTNHMELFINYAFSGFWQWLGAVILLWTFAVGIGIGAAIVRG